MERKVSFLPIFITVFIDMLGVGIVIPILAPLFLNPAAGVLPFNYTMSQRTLVLGFLIASFPLAQFFGAPILGALSDRFGRKKILMISLFGTLVGYLLFGFGIVYGMLPLLFISRVLDGFTGGNISIIMSSISDVSDAKSKAKNFGLVGFAFGLGFILGPYIGGKLADPNLVSWFSFDTPYWFTSILTAVNIFVVYKMFNETLHTKVNTKISIFTGFKNIKKALSMTNLRTMFVVVFLFSLGFSFFTQFYQVYLIQKFGMDQSSIGDIFAYLGLWIAITQGFIIRKLPSKFTPRKIMRFSVIGLGLAMFLTLVPSTSWQLFLVLPFVAVFNGLTQPNQTAIVSSLSDEKSQGEILGINQSIQSLAMSIPPIVSGVIFSIDKTLPTLVSGSVILLAGVIFILFFKEKKKEIFTEV